MRRRGWPGSPQGEGLIDVELLDGPADLPETADLSPTEPADPAPDSPAPDSRAPRQDLPRRRRRWWAGAVAVAVLAAVAVGANVAEAQRADARRAALADSPGFVPSLAEPLRETWRVQGTMTGATSDALLVAIAEGLQAVDPASGKVLWTHPRAGLQYCQTVGVTVDPMTGMPATDPDDAAAPQLLACTTGVAGDEGGAPGFGPVAVEILDATTGQVRTTLTASGALLGTIPVELDLVMALITAEGHLRVARWDPATGEAVFDTTTVEPVVPAGTAPGLGWYQTEDSLIVPAERPVAVSLTTGLEIPADGAPPADEWTVRIPMPDGAEAVWTRPATGAGRGEVVEADGTVRFEFTEMPWWARTTDDSAPEVMVVLDDTYTYVTGLDARTGRELWTLDTPSGQPTVQVDGVLVVIGPAVSLAVDVRDGRTLWSAPTAGVYASGITDGEVVVLTEAADPERPPEGQVVVARTIRDGAEVWRSPLPAGTSYLVSVGGGHVVGHTTYGIFGLG